MLIMIENVGYFRQKIIIAGARYKDSREGYLSVLHRLTAGGPLKMIIQVGYCCSSRGPRRRPVRCETM